MNVNDIRYVGAATYSEAEGRALLESGDYDVAMGSWGLIHTTLCIRSTVAPEAAAAEFTRHNPPGTSLNEWRYVADPELPDDQPYPVPCSDHPGTHVHILTAC